VEIIVGAVEIGGHDSAIISAVLTVIGFAQFDAGDFSDGVGFVGGFEGAGKQGVFCHGLFCQFRVNTGGPEEKQLVDIRLMGPMDDIAFHHQVLVNKLGGEGVVGVYAADFGGGEIDLVKFCAGKKGIDGLLVQQIQLGMGPGNDGTGFITFLQAFYNRRTNHAVMAGDI